MSDNLFMNTVIQYGHNIILKLPSGAYKLLQLQEQTHSCSLGKFGIFSPSGLVGQEYGRTYEILEDKTLKNLSVESLQTLEAIADSDSDIEFDEVGTNEHIQDNKEDNQGLSHEEIRDLRDSSHDRAALIEKIKQNNKSFHNKTMFSQAKYTKRKMSKFIRRFTTLPATCHDLIEYLLDKDGERILQVNQETMAYLLNTADVRPGSEYLIVDEVSGLLACSLLERGANITMIHDNENICIDIIKYLPQFDLDKLIAEGRIRSLTWEEAVDPETVVEECKDYIQRKLNVHIKDSWKAEKRKQLITAIQRHHGMQYDGLLVMSTYTPTSILAHLLPRIANSRKVVIYSTFREPLLSIRHEGFSQSLLMPQITELRARSYQILKGRTRPVMTQRGEFGYVYHAIKVKRKDDVQAVGRNMQKRNEKAKARKLRELELEPELNGKRIKLAIEQEIKPDHNDN